MTLKPIQGAPIDAPIPDFPTGQPGPLVVPAPRFTRRPAEPSPLPVPSPSFSPARQSGPIEVRGSDDGILIVRVIPEVPAINRSSLTILIRGEPAMDERHKGMPRLDLAIDEAKLFLLALRDGASPIVIADSRSGFQLEFAIADDGPAFTVSKPGHERTERRFNAGRSLNVQAMAAQLLAELGP